MDRSVKSPLLPPREIDYVDCANINAAEYDTSSLYRSLDSNSFNRGELSPHSTDVQPPESPVSSDTVTRLYKRRWYILFLYALMSAMESLIWNTWAPISSSVKKTFGWNDGDISLLANWGPIMYTLFMPVFAWMLDTKGLRWSVLIAMLCVTLGAGVRCIPTSQPSTLHKWQMNVGQILNGVAGPVGSGAMPVMSAQWFPPNERATATAIPMVAKYIALAGSFIIGPLLVPEVAKQNGTDLNLTTFSFEDCNSFSSEHWENHTNGSGVTIEDVKKDISFYLQLEAGVAGAVFLMILVYFPKKPPTPPCVSASVQRTDFLQGLKLLLRNGNFWLLTLVMLLVGGFDSAWTSVLSLNLIPVGASQKEAGWIGFYSFLAVCGVMLLIARVGDYFARHMKWYISIMYFVASVMYLWFALICVKILPFSTASIYIAIIVGQTTMNASAPLLYELACELVYPVGEGTSCGVLTGVEQAAAIIFLFIMMIPNIGNMWLNWGLLGATTLSTVLMLLVKEKHRRLEIDVKQEHKDQ